MSFFNQQANTYIRQEAYLKITYTIATDTLFVPTTLLQPLDEH